MTLEQILDKWREYRITPALRREFFEKELISAKRHCWFEACQQAAQNGDRETIIAWLDPADVEKRGIIQFQNKTYAWMMELHLRCALFACKNRDQGRGWQSEGIPRRELQSIVANILPSAPWGGRVSLGFVHDMITEMLESRPREPLRTESIIVPLVETDGRGVLARLTLSLMPDGDHTLYPTPELAFVDRDDDFREAEANALACIPAELWTEAWDVRWRFELLDGRAMFDWLEGNSVGLAFALVLAKLLVGL